MGGFERHIFGGLFEEHGFVGFKEHIFGPFKEHTIGGFEEPTIWFIRRTYNMVH